MSSNSIAVIDYGMGNLHSVASALQKVAPHVQIQVTGERRDILAAERVILPGVGAIRDCMAEIRRLEIDRAVAEVAASGKPLLAVCVGLQALMDFSEENGGVDCLGLFGGAVRSFAAQPEFARPTGGAAPLGERLKVPHMGWNEVAQTCEHPMWRDIPANSRFYFVHSFYVQAEDPRLLAGACHYGIDFAAVLARDNIFAAQFHPEKSHVAGLQLLKNFIDWDGHYAGNAAD